MVKFETTLGEIIIEMYPDKAPATVENFIKYVEQGFFDGTIFHRVIPGFVVQGGGFLPGLERKETMAPVKNEADNGLKNLRGTISMARTSDVNSATSQFFLNLVDNSNLDFVSKTPQGYGYCVFGKIIKGLEIIDEIAKIKTSSVGYYQDVPTKDIMIDKATIIE
ncbi:MAG: peptidyl-prolyl cis-trans isomerase [Spirochaetales bacterium]|nr:peptidyl-prolyl cis-trans isomerase [Spirochaetales bacterium]